MQLTHSAMAATASAPFQGWLAWAVTPVIVTSNQVRPLWATWICPSVGSVSSTHSSGPTQPALMAASTPRMKSSSSTEQMRLNPRRGRRFSPATRPSSEKSAERAQDRPPFMSQEPRP